MSDDVYREHKLTEAVTPPTADTPTVDPGGPPHPTHSTVAEQTREAQKGQDAHNRAQGHQDRLVDIGKANHSGGHSTGRHSDKG